MKALVKLKPEPGLWLRDEPVPEIGEDDVLIRVRRTGVCGTDLHIWEWDSWASNRLKPPVVIGHEFAGRIEKMGPEAAAEGLLSVGDLVTAEGHIICGHCLQCRTGNGHLCQRTSIIGVDRDGAFADYIAMPASNVMKLGGIPTEVGAIMDPMGNAFHTVLEGDAVIGSAVLVLGCGPIGCFAVGVARAAGASLVIASDFNDKRLGIASRMGAHVTLNPGRDDVLARIKEYAKPRRKRLLVVEDDSVEQMSIEELLGYDDIEIASWGAYDLTTVRQPMDLMVGQAIDLLLARLEHREAPVSHQCLPNELVIRGSTARQARPPPQPQQAATR